MIDVNSFLAWSQGLVHTFGYLGIFFISLISTSSVIFPTFPLSALVFLSASILNPFFVGISAGFGSATGELIGFAIGRGSEKVLLKKYEKKINKLEKLFQRYGGRFVIFFIAMIPIIPFDVIGLFCGIINYDIKKFYIALLIGKTIRYTLIALAGFYGINWVMSYI